MPTGPTQIVEGLFEKPSGSRHDDDIYWMFLMRMYHAAAYGDYLSQSYLLYAAYQLVEELGGDGQAFKRRVKEAHEIGWPKPRNGWPFPFKVKAI